jgi:hypothetical protein
MLLFIIRCAAFDDYYDATEKILPASTLYNLDENLLMMEYIPYIQSMIQQPGDPKQRQTRSKRKRLYLPLSDNQADMLKRNRKVIDEAS